MARRLRIGRVQRRDPLTGPRRLVQVPGRHRPLQRDSGPTVVEVAAAEVVVGVPGVGAEREQDRRRRGREVRAHHEEGMGPADLAVDVDRQDDLVVARRPLRLDADVGRGRPPAAGVRRIGWGRVIACRDVRFREHDGAGRTDVGDLDRHGPGAGRRQMETHPLAARHRLRPAVSGHRLVRHRPTLCSRPRPDRMRPIRSGSPCPCCPPSNSSNVP